MSERGSRPSSRTGRSRGRASQIHTALLALGVALAVSACGGDSGFFKTIPSRTAVGSTGVPTAEPTAQSPLATPTAKPTAQRPAATLTESVAEDERRTPEPRAREATATPTTQRYSGPPAMIIDPSKNYSAVIHTDKGDITVQLFAQQAPQTVNSFVFLARDGFYDGLTFFWVKPDFVAQTGDPENTGHGGPGYTIPDENSGEPFVAGTLGMAKKQDEANSAGSQFFITLTDQPQLNGEFTSFGRVTGGMDVLLSLTPRDPPSEDLPPGDRVLSIDILGG